MPISKTSKFSSSFSTVNILYTTLSILSLTWLILACGGTIAGINLYVALLLNNTNKLSLY